LKFNIQLVRLAQLNDTLQYNGYDVCKVTAYGRGIEKYCVEEDSPLEFTVDTRSAGVAPLEASVTDADYQPVDVEVKDNQDGTFQCRYVPKKRVKHVVVVTFGGVVIPNFPVRVSSQTFTYLLTGPSEY